MAITFIEQKKKQKNLLLISGVLLFITAIFLVQLLLKNLSLKMGEGEMFVSSFRQPQIDFTILESQALKDLEPFEGIGPFKGKVGRQNPFVPY